MPTSKANAPRLSTTSVPRRRAEKTSTRRNGASNSRSSAVRLANGAAPRYSSRPAAERIEAPSRKAESSWFVYLLYSLFVLGVAVIGALTYVLFLGS